MSDTPRTDARLHDVSVTCDDSCCEVYTRVDGEDCEIVPADFARGLERELDFYRKRFQDVIPNLVFGSWEEIWEQVRDKFKDETQ